jgi:hypothetical protein
MRPSRDRLLPLATTAALSLEIMQEDAKRNTASLKRHSIGLVRAAVVKGAMG